MDDFVRTMHEKSGPARRARQRHHASRTPSSRCSPTCASTARRARGRPLAGNTVGHRPRLHLPRHDGPRRVPALPDRRRLLDQGAVAAAGIPRAYFAAPAKRGNHRALADIQESIEELRYYRAAIFVPSPGPESAEAKALAQEHGGSLTGSRRRSPRWEFRGPDCPTLPHWPRLDPGPHGGCSSAGRAPRCGPEVAGSSPVTHPMSGRRGSRRWSSAGR